MDFITGDTMQYSYLNEYFEIILARSNFARSILSKGCYSKKRISFTRKKVKRMQIYLHPCLFTFSIGYNSRELTDEMLFPCTSIDRAYF